MYNACNLYFYRYLKINWMFDCFVFGWNSKLTSSSCTFSFPSIFFYSLRHSTWKTSLTWSSCSWLTRKKLHDQVYTSKSALNQLTSGKLKKVKGVIIKSEWGQRVSPLTNYPIPEVTQASMILQEKHNECDPNSKVVEQVCIGMNSFGKNIDLLLIVYSSFTAISTEATGWTTTCNSS